MNVLNRRALVKWLHWITAGAILYFYLVEPDVPEGGVDAARTAALSTHSGVGALLAVVVIIWTGMFLARGALGRPGPKLPDWGKRAHPLLNKGLYYGVPLMLLTGLVAGLTAPFAVEAFGLVPLNVAGMGGRTLHDIAYEIHEIAFDALTILVVIHAAFHIWRHVRLKDNALRLMLPRALHRYL